MGREARRGQSAKVDGQIRDGKGKSDDGFDIGEASADDVAGRIVLPRGGLADGVQNIVVIRGFTARSHVEVGKLELIRVRRHVFGPGGRKP